MRIKHALLILLTGALIAPTFLFSQFGGPRGGGGQGNGFNPEILFDGWAKGGNTLSRDMVPPRMQMMFDKMAESSGSKNGVVTREQFKAYMERYNPANMQKMDRGSMKMQFGGPMGGPPQFGGPISGSPPQFGGPMGGPPQFGGDRGSSRSPFGGPMGGPPSERGDRGERSDRGRSDDQSDRMAEGFFQRADRNRDGVLGFDELSERLQPYRDKYDSNNDGFIDLNEFKSYIKDQFAQREQNNDRPRENRDERDERDDRRDDYPPYVPNYNIPPKQEEEIRRPILMRVGKLPKELPSWFEQLDTDADGQVALYEWRRGSRDLAEFESYDFNADGFLIPEEVLKFMKVAKDATSSGSSDSARDGNSSGGDFSSRWGGFGGTSSESDKRREKGNERGKEGREKVEKTPPQNGGGWGGGAWGQKGGFMPKGKDGNGGERFRPKGKN